MMATVASSELVVLSSEGGGLAGGLGWGDDVFVSLVGDRITDAFWGLRVLTHRTGVLVWDTSV